MNENSKYGNININKTDRELFHNIYTTKASEIYFKKKKKSFDIQERLPYKMLQNMTITAKLSTSY